jgi:CO/xanthine dehydrogenase Mo-binding subunit
MRHRGGRQGGFETAVVRLEPSGGATVFTGISEIGHGIRSSLAQVAGEVLALPHDRVRVVLGDTERCPYSGATGGSRPGGSVGADIRPLAEQSLDEALGLAIGARGVGTVCRAYALSEVGRS